jgi:hypothetical protein
MKLIDILLVILGNLAAVIILSSIIALVLYCK